MLERERELLAEAISARLPVGMATAGGTSEAATSDPSVLADSIAAAVVKALGSKRAEESAVEMPAPAPAAAAVVLPPETPRTDPPSAARAWGVPDVNQVVDAACVLLAGVACGVLLSHGW